MLLALLVCVLAVVSVALSQQVQKISTVNRNGNNLFWSIAAKNKGKISNNLPISWKLSTCDISEQKVNNIDATVPGEVHLDLLRTGVLTEDPYFRYNEVNMSWVAKSCWQYESSPFAFDGLQQDSPVVLTFDNIDTVASVALNGVELGQTRNFFRSHEFEINPKDLQSMNKISVKIFNALDSAKSQAGAYPYVVPETQNYNVWAEPSNRNFIRKPGSDMGWDWGPAYVPAGIKGDVYARQCPNGCLDSIIVNQELASDFSNANLVIKANMDHLPRGGAKPLEFTILLNGKEVSRKTVSNVGANGDNKETVELGNIAISNPELWWPKGYGSPNLYDIEVICSDGFGRSTQAIKKRIGIRSVRLVQDPVNGKDDSRSFYFEVNGVPVYMKGANFIPIDSFQSRVTDRDRQYILDAASTANMNMLRVWGGGLYQTDDFYDLADEMGIMIWQEMMFACAMYPTTSEFLHEVSEEVRYQATRLHSHASIVVWGGNNENEVALRWFPESNANRDLYVSDYSKLYGSTIYPILMSVDASQRPWVDSSPSTGLISTDPYAKRWGQASIAQAGDVHFYDYSCDCEQSSSFPKARFISEFGFQSMPSYLAYEPVTTPNDWNPDSDLLLFRQRHENGNSQIQGQIAKHFNLPVSCSSSQQDLHYFDQYLYLTGIQQGRCYETAVNLWRQLKSSDAQTMGILYWQLNDIWQGPSWSSMEWGGRWKPLQYAIKRAYNDLVITSDMTANGVSFFVVSDLMNAVDTRVDVSLMSWSDSSVMHTWTIDAHVDKLSSKLVKNLKIAEILSATSKCTADSCYLKATVSVAGNTVTTYPSYTFLSTFRTAQLSPNAAIKFDNFVAKTDNEIQFSVTANATAPFLFMEVKNSPSDSKVSLSGVFHETAGWFSDNNFVAEANVKYDITYKSYENTVTVDKFKSMLKGRILQDTMRCV